MTEPATQRPGVYEPPPVILEHLANARSTLRFIKHALEGLSIDIIDDPSAADVRAMADILNQVVGQLRTSEQIAIPKYGEVVH